MISRLHERYRKEAVPALTKRFGYTNTMAVPRVEKVTLNIGLGEASQNVKLLDTASRSPGRLRAKAVDHAREESPSRISKFAKACRSAAWSRCAASGCTNFSTGCRRSFCRVCATLRACRPFVSIGRGNYTLGLKDQLVFPEIDYTRVDKIKGMNITITTTARTDEEGRELLKLLGVPFRTQAGKENEHGSRQSVRKDAAEAEVQDSRPESLPDLRAPARLSAQV